MTLRWGPIVFGFAFLLLSLHPFVVESLAWLVPINERSERPFFASSALVLVGMTFIAYGCFRPDQDATPPGGTGPDDGSPTGRP